MIEDNKKDNVELIEQLATKVHERWEAGRRAEGWIYGPVRDDEKKETPCLVPYEELPEEEKEFDRATAKETIQTLKETGYEIIKR